MPFTDFFCRASGSNLNGGGLATGAEPPTAAAYTSVGNWVNATRVFTPTSGTNPFSTVNVGDWASVYITAGATVATFIGRVTNVVNATNGAITIHASVSMGSAPADQTGTATIKVGGAWVGPSGVSNFPYGLSGLNNCFNTNGDQVRINIKNDQTYTFTSQVDFGNGQLAVTQGYGTTKGDGGKAIFTNNQTSSYGFGLTGLGNIWIDIIFVNTGASGTLPLVWFSGSGGGCYRCVFHGSRGAGCHQTTGTAVFVECEFYDNNKGNGSSYMAGLQTNGNMLIAVNCYSHDNTGGSNAHGFASLGGGIMLVNCIAESNTGIGFSLDSNGQGTATMINCDAYNNTLDGIKIVNTSTINLGLVTIRNCNLVKNGGKGINVVLQAQGGLLDNNGYGAGTQANGSADVIKSLLDAGTAVTYITNLTPWNAPTTGDFRIALAAAKNTGRSRFTETDGTNTGTVGYPDIGAAQHLDAASVSLTVGGVGGG